MINKGTSIIKAFYHTRHSKEQFSDFLRDYPNTKLGKNFNIYIKKLEWIERDFKTIPSLPQIVSEAMTKEMNGDILFPTAIAEKCLMLNEEQRETIEYLIDQMISGENIKVLKEKIEDENN